MGGEARGAKKIPFCALVGRWCLKVMAFEERFAVADDYGRGRELERGTNLVCRDMGDFAGDSWQRQQHRVRVARISHQISLSFFLSCHAILSFSPVIHPFVFFLSSYKTLLLVIGLLSSFLFLTHHHSLSSLYRSFAIPLLALLLLFVISC